MFAGGFYAPQPLVEPLATPQTLGAGSNSWVPPSQSNANRLPAKPSPRPTTLPALYLVVTFLLNPVLLPHIFHFSLSLSIQKSFHSNSIGLCLPLHLIISVNMAIGNIYFIATIAVIGGGLFGFDISSVSTRT